MMPPPICPPGSTPARDPEPSSRFVKRGGYVVCTVCNLATDYCRCARTPADAQSSDGAESGLAQRIADVLKQRQGGR